MKQNVNRSVNTEDEIFTGFRWAVSMKGFRSASVRYSLEEDPQRSVVDDRVTGAHYKVQNLEKLPELYRELAAVNIDKAEEIHAFATRYGLLNAQVGVFPDDESPLIRKQLTSDGFPLGNTLAFWKDQAWNMKCAVALWDKLRLKKICWLRQRISWKNGRFRYAPEPKSKISLAWFGVPEVSNPRLRAQFTPANTLFLAKYVLQHLINRQLSADRVAPMLLWRREITLDLYVKPLTLIGALWLQFAQDVANNHAIRWCPYCRKKKVVGASQKTYCSNSCKTMAWRKRSTPR